MAESLIRLNFSSLSTRRQKHHAEWTAIWIINSHTRWTRTCLHPTPEYTLNFFEISPSLQSSSISQFWPSIHSQLILNKTWDIFPLMILVFDNWSNFHIVSFSWNNHDSLRLCAITKRISYVEAISVANDARIMAICKWCLTSLLFGRQSKTWRNDYFSRELVTCNLCCMLSSVHVRELRAHKVTK